MWVLWKKEQWRPERALSCQVWNQIQSVTRLLLASKQILFGSSVSCNLSSKDRVTSWNSLYLLSIGSIFSGITLKKVLEISWFRHANKFDERIRSIKAGHCLVNIRQIWSLVKKIFYTLAPFVPFLPGNPLIPGFPYKNKQKKNLTKASQLM